MASPRKPRRANAAYLKKTPSEVHTGFAGYITETTGAEVDAATVALVQRLYPLYLKSPAVVQAREAEKAAREAEKAAKEQAKRERLQARLDKIEAERQRVLRDLGITDSEPTPLRVVEEDEFVAPDEDVEEPEVEVESGEVEDEDEESEDDDLFEDEDEDEEDF